MHRIEQDEGKHRQARMDGVSMVSSLWRRGCRAARSGQLSDAHVYLSSAIRVLGERLSGAGCLGRSSWPLKYLGGVTEMLRLYLQPGQALGSLEGPDQQGVTEQVFLLNIKSITLFQELSSIIASKPGCPVSRLESLSEDAASLLADARSIAEHVRMDDYSYNCLKTAALNLEIAERAARGLSSFLEGVAAAKAGRFIDAEIAFRRASRISAVEYRDILGWPLILGYLYQAYAVLTRAEAQGRYIDYVEAQEAYKRLVELVEEPAPRGHLLAASSLCAGYADLLRCLAGHEEAAEHALREISSAHSLYSMMDEDRLAALCSALEELLKLLLDREDAGKRLDIIVASRIERVSSLLEGVYGPVERIASLEQLLAILRPGRLLIESACKMLPRRLMPLLLDPPPLEDGFLLVCSSSGSEDGSAACLLNIGSERAWGIRVARGEGGLEAGGMLGPLEKMPLLLADVDGYVRIDYSRGGGRTGVVLLRRVGTLEKTEPTPIPTRISAIDSQLGGGLRPGETYVLLIGDGRLVKRLIRGVAEQRGIYILLVSSRQHAEETVGLGENIELVLCGPRGSSEGRITSIKGVEDLSLLSRVVASRLEERGGEGYKGAVVIFDVLSDILLLHKLLTTRRWINDIVSRLRDRSRASLIFLLNTQLHGREEINGVTELFENVVETLR